MKFSAVCIRKTEQTCLEVTLDFIREMLSSNISGNIGHPDHECPQSLQAHAGIVPRLGHDFCLPYPFQFIILRPVSRRYIVSALKASLNNPKRNIYREKAGGRAHIFASSFIKRHSIRSYLVRSRQA
jgi:hypothetical protein